MLKIGLTGTIASGKSEVEKILKESFLVVDLDEVSHELLVGAAKKEVLAEFKTIDRKKLASIIFCDSEKKRALEAILHPKLKTYVLNLFKTSSKPVVVSGALLYEAGFFPLFDKTIFIDAPYETRLERLQKRNSLTKEEALIRINSQSDIARNFCDFVIENKGGLEELKEEVARVIRQLG